MTFRLRAILLNLHNTASPINQRVIFWWTLCRRIRRAGIQAIDFSEVDIRRAFLVVLLGLVSSVADSIGMLVLTEAVVGSHARSAQLDSSCFLAGLECAKQ